MEEQKEKDILEQLALSVSLGQHISDLLGAFDDRNLVECIIAASIDAWAKDHDGDALAIAEDMLEMMKTVHAERGE